MRLILAFPALLLASCNAAPPSTPEQTAAATPAAVKPPAADAPVVLAFGDSLYAGYGLKPGESYPAKLEAALNAAGTPARFVNAGVSGDTSAAGLQRLAFTLDNQPSRPVLVMVGLGGNDMLRGLPPEQLRANLDAILSELARRKIPAMLTGMLAAPNLGADYVETFNTTYPLLAKKYDVPLVPFLLQPVFGKKELILPDGVHPNAAGIDLIVAATKDQVGAALKSAQGSN